jgi:hypothetical protein
LIYAGHFSEKIETDNIFSFAAIITGADLGPGIYFTDCFTKAVSFCHPTEHSSEVHTLLAADVAVGEVVETYEKKRVKLPNRVKTVLGCGKKYVFDNNARNNIQHIEDLNIPTGRLKTRKRDCALGHNEFVITDKRQARLNYHIRFQVTKL